MEDGGLWPKMSNRPTFSARTVVCLILVFSSFLIGPSLGFITGISNPQSHGGGEVSQQNPFDLLCAKLLDGGDGRLDIHQLLFGWLRAVFQSEHNWLQEIVGSYTSSIPEWFRNFNAVPLAHASDLGSIQPDIPYVDPSYTQPSTNTYVYTTSFGIYTISYLTALNVYSVAFKNGDTIVTASVLAVLENSSGSWLPINKQPTPNRFTIGPSVFITIPTGERFAITQTLDYKDKSIKETLGELTLIISFTKSAFPKISVALNKDSYKIDPTCVDTLPYECERETYWNKVGLKDLQWIWAVAPASGYDKYQSKTFGEVNITTVAAILDEEPSVRADFKGAKDWYADWSSVGSSEVAVEPSTVSIRGQSVLVVRFAVNMTVIDPTFGLTSTGSTSYPTAKAITANGNAQVDTAQSKFGGASGLFDGTGDYLSTPDSADWFFNTGAFTIDFPVRFQALPGTGAYMSLWVQYQDSSNYHALLIHESSGAYYWYYILYVNGSAVATFNVAATTAVNTWYHIALVRSGTTFTLYKDGTGIGTDTDAGAVPDLSAVFTVADGTYSLNGWIDEFRVSKGVARWTSNFTPPAYRYERSGCLYTSGCVAPGATSPDSYTVFLLHNDGTDTSPTFLDDVSTGQALFGKFTLTETASSVTSMSVYSHAAGDMRASIFTDSSGPSTKLCETADTAVSATAWTSPDISGCGSLSAADYWLGLQWNPGAAYLAGPSYTAGSANTGYRLYMAYGAFPSSGAGGALTAENYSVYVTYATGPTTYTRTATLQQTGSFSGSGQVQFSRLPTLSVSSSFQADRVASVYRAGSAAISELLTSSDTLAANRSGSLSIGSNFQPSMIANFYRAGTGIVTELFTASRELAENRPSSFSSTGSFSADRLAQFVRSSFLSLTAGFSVNTLVMFYRDGTLLASGVLAGERQVGEQRTATLTTTGTLSAAGIGDLLRNAVVGINATLTASRLLELYGNAVLSITGNFNSSSIREFYRIGSTDMTATLSANRVRGVAEIVSFILTGTFDAVRNLLLGRTATLTTTGSFLSDRVAAFYRQGTLLATGVLAGERQVGEQRAATLTATGTLSAAGIGGLLRNAVVGINATLTSSRLLGLYGNAILSLASNFQPSMIRSFYRTGTGTVTGTFSTDRWVQFLRSGFLSLTGSFLSDRVVMFYRAATMQITMVLSSTRTVPTPLVLGGGGGTMLYIPPYVPPIIIEQYFALIGAVGSQYVFPTLTPEAKVHIDASVSNQNDDAVDFQVNYWITDPNGNKVFEDVMPSLNVGARSTVTEQLWGIVKMAGQYTFYAQAIPPLGFGEPVTATQTVEASMFTVWIGAVATWFLIALAGVFCILLLYQYAPRRRKESWYFKSMRRVDRFSRFQI